MDLLSAKNKNCVFLLPELFSLTSLSYEYWSAKMLKKSGSWIIIQYQVLLLHNTNSILGPTVF